MTSEIDAAHDKRIVLEALCRVLFAEVKAETDLYFNCWTWIHSGGGRERSVEGFGSLEGAKGDAWRTPVEITDFGSPLRGEYLGTFHVKPDGTWEPMDLTPEPKPEEDDEDKPMPRSRFTGRTI